MYSKFLCASAIVLCSTITAHAENKWDPTFELEGRVNDDRSIAAPKFLIPIMQNETSMFFTDIRSRFDDHNSEEYNIGLGYRQMHDGWIYGGYAFLDRLYSSNDFGYWQGMFGVEALSENWDARLNAYLPESKKNGAGGGGGGGLIIDSGGNFAIGGTGGLQERALPGFDAEIGYRLPIDAVDLRVFGGAYYFDASGFDTVAGPKARVELTFDDSQIEFFNPGMEFTLGVQYQNDDEREGTTTALAQFRLPFGGVEKSKLTKLEKRMTNFIERDVDIVTAEGSAGGGSELATVEIEGQSFTRPDLVVNAGTSTAVADIAAANTGALIIFDGALGEIDAGADRIEPRDGQFLIGAGTIVNVIGNTSGHSFTDVIPGTRPTITSTNNGVFWLDSEQDVVMKGLDISPTSAGIILTSADTFHILIDDVNIAGHGGSSTNDGIEISFAANDITIQNSTISDVGATGIEIRGNSSDITLDNIAISDTALEGIAISSNINANITATDVTIENTGSFGLMVSDSNDVSTTGFTITNPADHAVRIFNTADSQFNNFNITSPTNGIDAFNIEDSDNIAVNSIAANINGDVFDIDDVTNGTGGEWSGGAFTYCVATGTNTGTSYSSTGGAFTCP